MVELGNRLQRSAHMTRQLMGHDPSYPAFPDEPLLSPREGRDEGHRSGKILLPNSEISNLRSQIGIPECSYLIAHFRFGLNTLGEIRYI